MDAALEVTVAGALADVRFPNLCARCAAPPAGTLPLVKMFRRIYPRKPAIHVFGRLDVPFCRSCLAAHERARAPVDPAVPRTLRTRWLLKSLVYVIPIAVTLFFVREFVPTVASALSAGDLVRALVFGGILAIFGALLWMFVRRVIDGRRALIADHAGDPNDSYVEVVPGPMGSTCVIPGPPTPTLAAVNFDDDRMVLFEPARRTVTFTNALVAEQFATLNSALVWDPATPHARRAAGARWLVGALLLVAGIAALAWEWMRP
jgi:hypothetical protein